jgi:hypothetical protein
MGFRINSQGFVLKKRIRFGEVSLVTVVSMGSPSARPDVFVQAM